MRRCPVFQTAGGGGEGGEGGGGGGVRLVAVGEMLLGGGGCFTFQPNLCGGLFKPDDDDRFLKYRAEVRRRCGWAKRRGGRAGESC